MTTLTVTGISLMLFGTVMSTVGYILQRKRMKRKGTERSTKSVAGVVLLLLGFCITIPVGIYYCLVTG